jgi:hypothetical protein
MYFTFQSDSDNQWTTIAKHVKFISHKFDLYLQILHETFFLCVLKITNMMEQKCEVMSNNIQISDFFYS